MSNSLASLLQRLSSVDELLEAWETLRTDAAGNVMHGRPVERRGSAIIGASVVLMAATFEAYVEGVYREAVDGIHGTATTTTSLRNNLKQAADNMNNADVKNVNRLFCALGIPAIMSTPNIRWQNSTNTVVQNELVRLVAARHQVAHLGVNAVRKQTAFYWRGIIERLATRFDDAVADRIVAMGRIRPW